MNRFSSLLCSLLFCMITYAQEITVTGKVTAGGARNRRHLPRESACASRRSQGEDTRYPRRLARCEQPAAQRRACGSG